jgi:hypothetical protein
MSWDGFIFGGWQGYPYVGEFEKNEAFRFAIERFGPAEAEAAAFAWAERELRPPPPSSRRSHDNGGPLPRFPGYGEQMRARAYQNPLLLDCSCCVQDVLPTPGLIPLLPEQPARALDTKQRLKLQTRVFNLCSQLVGMVEESGCEPIGAVRWIPVLTLCKVALDDRVELGVTEPATDQTIQERREPRDRSCHNHSPRPQHAPSLLQRADSLVSLREVVKGTEHQDGVA